MSTAKRLMMLLAVIACLPLITAGGGINPPISGTAVVTLSNIKATIMLDPHPNTLDFATNSTSSGRTGQITLERSGLRLATETFELVYPFGSFGPLALGCTTDPTATLNRLGSAANPVTMNQWIPQDVLVKAFAQIGINVYSATPPTPPLLEPIITQVRVIRCVQSVAGATPPDGFLLVEANIGFYAEPNTKIPHP